MEDLWNSSDAFNERQFRSYWLEQARYEMRPPKFILAPYQLQCNPLLINGIDFNERLEKARRRSHMLADIIAYVNDERVLGIAYSGPRQIKSDFAWALEIALSIKNKSNGTTS